MLSHTLLYSAIGSYFILLGIQSSPSCHAEFKKSVWGMPFFLLLAAAVAHYQGQ